MSQETVREIAIHDHCRHGTPILKLCHKCQAAAHGPAYGWAVVDRFGKIILNTVYSDRRGAMVNYLATVHGYWVSNLCADDRIEDKFQQIKGQDEVIEVKISVKDD